MAALEQRLNDINERLATSSVHVARLARLARRREVVFSTADEIRDRLDRARLEAQRVDAEIARSRALFKYGFHRRRVEGFLAPHARQGYVAAGLYLVLEHELRSVREELDEIEERIRSLGGQSAKHQMLVQWRDELVASLGPDRMPAAQHALMRVSAAVEVAERVEDARILEEAMSVGSLALADMEAAVAEVQHVGRLESEDVASLADLIPEGVRHYPLRESKRRVEQATLRFGFVQDELESVEGLNVQVRHPYAALEEFLGGAYDDYQAARAPTESLVALEDAQQYAHRLFDAIEAAHDQALEHVERARQKEEEVVGHAVEQVATGPARLQSRYSSWDALY
jgi:hypothetical protein